MTANRPISAFQPSSAQHVAVKKRQPEDSPISRAVPYRNTIAAHLVDEATLRKKSPHVVSIAARHLGEFNLSLAAERGTIGSWLVLDQDEHNIDFINANFGHHNVTAEVVSFGDLLSEHGKFANRDLVYAAELLDRLHDEAAVRLIRIMADMLNPGGRMMVSNFIPGSLDASNLENVLDAQPICRNEIHILKLFGEALFAEEAIHIFKDPDNAVVFAIGTREL